MKLAIIFLAFLQTISSYYVSGKLQKVTNESFSIGPRIYGGDEAPEGLFKFMVMVLSRVGNSVSFCSGSRISENWVLLAAHCIPEGTKDNDIILVGNKAKLDSYLEKRLNMSFYDTIDDDVFGAEERRSDAYYRYSDYVDSTKLHDIALIHLASAFTEKVEILKISTEQKNELLDCIIVGWGRDENNNMNGNLKYGLNKRAVTPHSGCTYRTEGDFYCLSPGKDGICHGDSGSPLVCGGVCWGVASHLIFDPSNAGCGKEMESYYTEVYPYRNWIKSYVKSVNSGIKITCGSVHGVIITSYLLVRSS